MRARRPPPLLLLLALLVSAPACVKQDIRPRFTPAWEEFEPTGEDWITTRQAMLIADCQIHNLLSRALPDRNLSADAAAATAIRPPQLDLFSGDVLAWVLKNGAPEAEVILHLGDALDLATTGEFDQFLDVMKSAEKPWFMAPGNHDFFYLGTYDPANPRIWKRAAYGSGGPMTKDEFIRRYVTTLLRQDEPGCVALAGALGHALAPEGPLPKSFEWRAPEETPGYLKAICWKINEEEPWRSFLLQCVELTRDSLPARVYLLDSCQYGRRPELIPNGWRSYPLHLNCGFTGEMLPDQLRKLREWLESREPYHAAIAMCHHPFDSLSPRTRSSLGWLWKAQRIAMMVTAHTHDGYYAHHDLGGRYDEIELNIGSTTDWPMEWRTLAGYVNEREEKIYIQSRRHTLVQALQKHGGYFRPGWEVPLDAPDDYRKYNQGEAASAILVEFYLAHHVVPYWIGTPHVEPNKSARHTERQVKDTLLWTYYRLVDTFPTDPATPPAWPAGCSSDQTVLKRIKGTADDDGELVAKIALLKELAEFERSRKTVDDDARARFKLSQAAWASRFESSRGRRLRVQDELIRLDWKKTALRWKEAESESKRRTEPQTR